MQALVEAKKWAEAHAGGKALLSRLESEGQGETLEAGRAIDLMVRSGLSVADLRTPELVRLAERSIRIKESLSPGDHMALGRGYFQLANAVRMLVGRQEAVPLYGRAIAEQELGLGPDDPELARSIANLAILNTILGDYAAADPLYERAAGILEARLGPMHGDVGAVVAGWGNLRKYMGDYEGALPLLERMLAIAENSDGPDSVNAAMSRMNLANLLNEMGDDEGAIENYVRCTRILEAYPGYTGAMGLVDSNHARARLQTGDVAEATRLVDRAMATLDSSPGSQHWGLTLALKGDLLRETGRPDRAVPLYLEAVKAIESAYGPDHPFVTDALDGLALARWSLQDSQAALEGALRSERIARDHFVRTAGIVSEEMALRLDRSRRSSLDTALSILVSLPEARRSPAMVSSVWEAAVRSTAVVLGETAARQRRARDAGDPVARRAWQTLVAARNDLARQFIQGPPEKDQAAWLKRLEETEQARKQAERAVAASSPWYERQIEMDRIGIEEIFTDLPPGAALVRYVAWQQRRSGRGAATPSYAAFVRPAGGGSPRIVPLGRAASIDEAILQWRGQIESSRAGLAAAGGSSQRLVRKAGSRLREKIWDPLAGALEGATMVLVVMSGELNHISLAALPGRKKEFLLEESPLLHYLSVERDVVPADASVARGQGMLAIGGPDYDAPAGAGAPASSVASLREGGGRRGCDPLQEMVFAPLPAALREASQISAKWDAAHPAAEERARAVRLTGSRADESAVKRLVTGRSVIHLATHAFFLDGACLPAEPPAGASHAKRAAEAGVPRSRLARQPLLNAGLALAGANRRLDSSSSPPAEDGLLMAEEVAGLDLDGVDWLVLSACDTGIGELSRGDGVLGLRRAFRIAGAKTIVMSLWKVGDEATADWMGRLYDARVSGLSTAESVRQASLEMLESLRRQGRPAPPCDWAGFIAVGDWR